MARSCLSRSALGLREGLRVKERTRDGRLGVRWRDIAIGLVRGLRLADYHMSLM